MWNLLIMTKKLDEVLIEPVIEQSYISIIDMFGGKDLLKDGSNLSVKVNVENHYFQHIHRLGSNPKCPFYYVINFDNIQYKGGPYKDIYVANRACTAKLYELYNLEDQLIIKCDTKKYKEELLVAQEDKDKQELL